MYIVSQLQGDLEEVLGGCTRDVLFRRLDAALDRLAPMLPTDSNIGLLDLCIQNCEFTLPYFVEVPLAVNIAGHPADFRNKWYEHHLNGIGSTCCGQSCVFGWQNQGLYPVFRDLTSPSYLAAYSDGVEESIQSLIIMGEDHNGKPLYSCQGEENVMKPGLVIPINTGGFSFAQMENNVKVKRITQVIKPLTNDFVRLIAFDEGRPNEGTLIGYYRPDEQVPAYRRMKVSGTCNPDTGCKTEFNPAVNCCDPEVIRSTWVRMRYQRRQMPITTLNDVIYVPSREAIINAVEAIEQYRTNNKQQGDQYMLMARQALEEKQESLEGPNSFQAQYPNAGTYGGDGIHNMI